MTRRTQRANSNAASPARAHQRKFCGVGAALCALALYVLAPACGGAKPGATPAGAAGTGVTGVAGIGAAGAAGTMTSGAAGAGTGSAGSSGQAGAPPAPTTSCDVPADGQAADVSSPTTVVGDGTAASCTAAALDAAVQKAGVVTFNCGSAPVTITLTQQIRINNVGGADKLGDTVIDGGGKVTLSGGGKTRILYLNACEKPYNSDHCDTYDHPRLTVQNISLEGGFSSDTNRCGAAIYANGGLVKVVNARFSNNHGVVAARDVAGGAIATYLQSKPDFVVGSTFDGNSCASGGALGSINTSWSVYNSVFSSNNATGQPGNPDMGGNGGAISNDGGPYHLTICGTKLVNNTAVAFGGAVFQVSNSGDGFTTVGDSTVQGNASTKSKHSGGMYIQGTKGAISGSTFAGNMATFAGGLFVTPNAGKANSVDLLNVTFTKNQASALEVDAAITGAIKGATIADNDKGVSGGAKLSIGDSVVANNAGGNCTAAHASAGGGNVQFPQGGTACTSDVAYGDPMLGALAANGGPTETMLPAAGSAAAKAGKACPATDQRGTARPANGCTSGAVEVP